MLFTNLVHETKKDKYIYYACKYQKLSVDFMTKNANKLIWDLISRYQTDQFTPEFKEKFKDRLC